MLGDLKQQQHGGDGSVNIQASEVRLGISYSEARQIALDVFQANFYKLSEEALATAKERSEQLVDSYLKKLNERYPDAVNSAREPGMQYALYIAQKEYARTGDQDLEELLVDILVDRANEQKRTLLQIVLDESLSVATKLTTQQMDILSIVFLLRYTQNSTILSVEALKEYIEQFLVPFIDNIPENLSAYQHLEYCGCGSVSLGQILIPEIFKKTYPGIFCKGFPQESFTSITDSHELFSVCMMPCFHNTDLWQINALNSSAIDNLGLKHQLSPEIVSKLRELQISTLMNDQEVKDILIKTHPAMSDLINKWEKSSLKNLTLTSVGIAIAHANIRRKCNEQIDLSIWLG